MYGPAWKPDDAATASARCLEARGDYESALNALRTVFYHHMSANDLDDAGAILDWARALALDEDTYADMEGRYSARAERYAEPPPETEPPPVSRRKPVVVLFIGGDESLAKSNQAVEAQVREQDAGVSVDFVAIDWTPNWTKTLKEVESKLPEFNAVVLSRFMRTTCGQHARRLCSKHNIPWRFCYGAGRGLRMRAVLKAAEAGRLAGRP